MSNTISITLRIKDKNITFEDKVEERKYKEKNSLFYFGKLIHSPKRCKLCEHKNTNYSIIKNGFKKSCLTIPKVYEKPAYLILEKQRFYCKKCCS